MPVSSKIGFASAGTSIFSSPAPGVLVEGTFTAGFSCGGDGAGGICACVDLCPQPLITIFRRRRNEIQSKRASAPIRTVLFATLHERSAVLPFKNSCAAFPDSPQTTTVSPPRFVRPSRNDFALLAQPRRSDSSPAPPSLSPKFRQYSPPSR